MAGALGLSTRAGLRLGIAAPSKRVRASDFASYPAPSGYRWDFITIGGARVKLGSEPLVALVRMI